MTTLIVFHEVEDGARWARAWRAGSGSRHEMFDKIGVSARTFRDPERPERTGLLLDVPDLKRFQSFIESDEARRAMTEDGLRVDTLQILEEFKP